MTALKIIRSNKKTLTYWRAGKYREVCTSLEEALEYGPPIQEYTETTYDIQIGPHKSKGVRSVSKEIKP